MKIQKASSAYPDANIQRKNKIFETELYTSNKRYVAVLPDGMNIHFCLGIKIEINGFIEKYNLKTHKYDDPTEMKKAIKLQGRFDKRAFLEFKNTIDKEFDDREEQFKLMTNPPSEIMRYKSPYDLNNKLMLYTPEGYQVNQFSDIEGIYDISKANLGFLVASWTGYFMGMEGYDPDLGHNFQKFMKEKVVRSNIEKLENEWHIKRNEYSSSNPGDRSNSHQNPLK